MVVNKTFYSWLAAYEWAKSQGISPSYITASNEAPLRWTLTYRSEEI